MLRPLLLVLSIGGCFGAAGCTGLAVRADDAARIVREASSAAVEAAASHVKEAGRAALEAAVEKVRASGSEIAAANAERLFARMEAWAEKQRAPDGSFPSTPAGLAAIAAMQLVFEGRKWVRDRRGPAPSKGAT